MQVGTAMLFKAILGGEWLVSEMALMVSFGECLESF
jgi:hypothetical protein